MLPIRHLKLTKLVKVIWVNLVETSTHHTFPARLSMIEFFVQVPDFSCPTDLTSVIVQLSKNSPSSSALRKRSNKIPE